MGWMAKLCEAYDAAIETTATGEDTPLLRLGFAEKTIKYLVIVKADGTFSTAQLMPEEQQHCVVPTTAQAESRTGSAAAPYPLAEQLKYFYPGSEFGLFKAYLKQLSDWCSMETSPACLKTLLYYLEKETLLEDMALSLSDKVISAAEEKSFVCFAVQDGAIDSRLWTRQEVLESWKQYSAMQQGSEFGLCYVTGERLPIMDSHPKVEGNAKLISAKDAAFRFQYKGRFEDNASAATVSAEASTKAHNALKWLTARQGLHRYGMTSLAWNTNGCIVKLPFDEMDFLLPPAENESETKANPDTFDLYGQALRDAAKGKNKRLAEFGMDKPLPDSTRQRMNEVNILCLEAATNGRMSVTYYQQMPGGTYVDCLEKWYESCCWEMWNFEKKAWRISSPNFERIASAIMGEDQFRIAKTDYKCDKAAGKLLRELYLRLLMCVTKGESLPKPYVTQALRRTVVPLSFTDSKGKWQRNAWRQHMCTACAMLRKELIDEQGISISFELDQNCHDRSYLYGRLLAVADKLEQDANRLTAKDADLPTNAIRMMYSLYNDPADVYPQLHTRLLPYLSRLGADGFSADFYQRLIGSIEQKFSLEDRHCEDSLSELLIVGYFAQHRDFWRPHEQCTKAESSAAFCPPATRDELYGCLLAVADVAEWRSESHKEGMRYLSLRDGRTNALRLMSVFASDPKGGWAKLHDKLIPYMDNLGTKQAGFYQYLLRCIEVRFETAERCADKPLSSLYLRGYYQMRSALRCSSLDIPQWNIVAVPMKLPNTREAVFGALLALEDRTERIVLDSIQMKDEMENRSSNAMRFLSQAAVHPAETWEYLQKRLHPYANKLNYGNTFEEIEALKCQVSAEELYLDKPLGSEYLHYFYTYDKRRIIS